MMYIFGDKPKNAWDKIYSVARRILKPNGWFISADYEDWKNYDSESNTYKVMCTNLCDWDKHLVLCESKKSINGAPKDACHYWERGADWDEVISSIQSRNK